MHHAQLYAQKTPHAVAFATPSRGERRRPPDAFMAHRIRDRPPRSHPDRGPVVRFRPLPRLLERHAVEGDRALADLRLLAPAAERLADLHLERAVEGVARRDALGDFIASGDPIDRRSEARPSEPVVHLLADHHVVGAASGEEVHAGGDLAVAQKRCARHRVVPVAVDPPEGQHRGEGVRIDLAQAQAGAKGVGQPDQRTDLVPEVVADAEPPDERLEALHERAAPRRAGEHVASRGTFGWQGDARHGVAGVGRGRGGQDGC